MNDVRVALERARRDPEVELGMLGGLFLVWVVHAPTEGFERINSALDRTSPSPGESLLKAGHAWHVLGGITGLRWEKGTTENRLLQLIGDSDNTFFNASLEMGMGYAAERVHNDVDAAYRHLVTGVELHQVAGPGPQLAMAMGSLGSMETQRGRPDVGRVWIEKAVTMALEIDDQYGAVGAYFHLGYLELDSGARERALAAFVAGLAMVEGGDTLSTADQVAGIACAVAASDPQYALRLFSAASRLRSMMGPPVAEPWRPRVDAGVREARAALSAAEADAAIESAKALTSETLLAEVRDRFSAHPGPRPKPEHGLSAREMEVHHQDSRLPAPRQPGSRCPAQLREAPRELPEVDRRSRLRPVELQRLLDRSEPGRVGLKAVSATLQRPPDLEDVRIAPGDDHEFRLYPTGKRAQVARWRPFVIPFLLSLVTLLLLVAIVSGATPQSATPARSHPVVLPGPPPGTVL